MTTALKSPCFGYNCMAVDEESFKLKVTSAAKDKILALRNEKQKEGHVLRVYIQSGGCAGMEYRFDFVDNTDVDSEADILCVYNGSPLVIIDKHSMKAVEGAALDYVEYLTNSTSRKDSLFQKDWGFKIFNNPNARTGCGCGKSFA